MNRAEYPTPSTYTSQIEGLLENVTSINCACKGTVQGEMGLVAWDVFVLLNFLFFSFFFFFENSSAWSFLGTQKEHSAVFLTVLKTSQKLLTHIYTTKMFLNISPGAKQEKYVVVLVIQPRFSELHIINTIKWSVSFIFSFIFLSRLLCQISRDFSYYSLVFLKLEKDDFVIITCSPECKF